MPRINIVEKAPEVPPTEEEYVGAARVLCAKHGGLFPRTEGHLRRLLQGNRVLEGSSVGPTGKTTAWALFLVLTGDNDAVNSGVTSSNEYRAINRTAKQFWLPGQSQPAPRISDR